MKPGKQEIQTWLAKLKWMKFSWEVSYVKLKKRHDLILQLRFCPLGDQQVIEWAAKISYGSRDGSLVTDLNWHCVKQIADMFTNRDAEAGAWPEAIEPDRTRCSAVWSLLNDGIVRSAASLPLIAIHWSLTIGALKLEATNFSRHYGRVSELQSGQYTGCCGFTIYTSQIQRLVIADATFRSSLSANKFEFCKAYYVSCYLTGVLKSPN